MRAIPIVFLLAGCGSLFGQHQTARGIRLDGDTWPHEVEYELLVTTTGKACGAIDSPVVKQGASKDPALNGPPALFEQAKYLAIGAANGADGLAAIRSFVETNDQTGFVCVTVTGRAYRLTKMRAGASPTTAAAVAAQPSAARPVPIPSGIMLPQ